jgi:hypothetical protein
MISPEVLKTASDKFLWRCGFQATAGRGMVEGYGYLGNGALADPNGATAHARRMMDAGAYRYMRPLSLKDVEKIDAEQFGVAQLQAAHETGRERLKRLAGGIQAL